MLDFSLEQYNGKRPIVLMGDESLSFDDLSQALAGDFEITSLDVHEFPLFIAFAAPLAKSASGLKPRLPCGRGLSKAGAMIGAAAEALELRASLAQNLHPGRYDFEKREGLDHLALLSLGGGQSLLVPAQEVFLDYAPLHSEPLLRDADSTGCATAPAFAEAEHRALLECIERDALATWWYGRLPRPHMPLDLLDEVEPRLAWWLANRSRKTLLIDLTSDIAVPCVAAVSADKLGLDLAVGTAAALSTRAALLSAVLEMLQMEVSMQLGASKLNTDLATWQAQATTRVMPQFAGKPRPVTFLSLAPDALVPVLKETGFSAYSIELTLPNDPLATARVLVPGFSSLGGKVNEARIHKARGPDWKDSTSFETLEPY